MNEFERGALLQSCRQASEALGPIYDALGRQAAGQPDPLTEYRKALHSLGAQAKKLTREWRRYTEGQLLLASVLCFPEKLSSLLEAEHHALPPNAVDLLHRLVERPAFVCSFSVEEDLRDDLFVIVDHSSSDRRLIHSPALSQLARIKARSHMSLLFDNGSCLQAIGVVRYYRALEPFDFHFYGKMLNPEAYAATGLQALMTSSPEWFVLLDYVAEIPPIAHAGTALQVLFSSVSIAAFDAGKLGEEFETAEGDDLVRCRLRASKPPMLNADVYYDRKAEVLSVHATTQELYDRCLQAVRSQAELPEQPQWKATLNMETTTSMLLKRHLPFFGYDHRIKPPTRDPEADRELAKINALMRALTDRRNTGKEYSLEDLARRHGVTLENARAVEQSLHRMEARWAIDVEGGFPDVRRLPPADVMKMGSPLEECPLFSLHGGSNVQELFRQLLPKLHRLSTRGGGEPVRLADLPRLLEDCDYDQWQEERNSILKYTMFLLCLKGADYEDVSDYAAEILRLFWQVLLPGKERMHIRRFVRQYAIYCRETLARGGLIDIREHPKVSSTAPGAPFAMKSSAFLSAWISLGAQRPERRGR